MLLSTVLVTGDIEQWLKAILVMCSLITVCRGQAVLDSVIAKLQTNQNDLGSILNLLYNMCYIW